MGQGVLRGASVLVSAGILALLPNDALAFHNAYGVHQRVATYQYQPQLHRNQHHPQRTSASASLKAVETTTAYTFVSSTYHVYIEDTDAYGVIYNGNYIRCYERALSHVPRNADDSCSSWIVSSVTNQKFRSSPALGDNYVIRGILLGEGNERGGQSGEVTCRRDEDEEVWQLEMATRTKKVSNSGENEADDNDNGNNWIVHNSATVTILNTLRYSSYCSTGNTPSKEALFESIPPPRKLDDHGCGTILFEQRCTAYRDEFDTCHFQLWNRQAQQSSSYRPQYILPIRNAMNFFERSRTNYLGGPATLRKMQVDEDILWVVTTVDDGEVMGMLDGGSKFGFSVDNEMKGSSATSEKVEDVSPVHVMSSTMATSRRDVIVRTDFVVKRRGMIVECRHELYLDHTNRDVIGLSDDDNKTNSLGHRNKMRLLLAKATVTVMGLNGSTRRPTSNLPQWILDQIMGTTSN